MALRVFNKVSLEKSDWYTRRGANLSDRVFITFIFSTYTHTRLL